MLRLLNNSNIGHVLWRDLVQGLIMVLLVVLLSRVINFAFVDILVLVLEAGGMGGQWMPPTILKLHHTFLRKPPHQPFCI